MAKSLKQLPRLARPVLTTRDDVILIGQGLYLSDGETAVPPGFELWVMAPEGALLASPLRSALEAGLQINKLGVVRQATGEWSPLAPIVYTAGMQAPNYTLYPAGSLKPSPKQDGPRVMSALAVNGQRLSASWRHVQLFAHRGRPLRVFWVACGVPSGGKQQGLVVYHE